VCDVLLPGIDLKPSKRESDSTKLLRETTTKLLMNQPTDSEYVKEWLCDLSIRWNQSGKKIRGWFFSVQVGDVEGGTVGMNVVCAMHTLHMYHCFKFETTCIEYYVYQNVAHTVERRRGGLEVSLNVKST
jgi:hypothetical protein